MTARSPNPPGSRGHRPLLQPLYMKFGVWLRETSSASAGENPII